MSKKKRKSARKHISQMIATTSAAPSIEAAKNGADPTPDAQFEEPEGHLSLGRLAADFVLQMEALKQTLSIAGAATEIFEKKTQDEFEAFADTVGGKRTALQDGSVSIAIPASQQRAAERIFRSVDIFQRGKQALASNFLIALVAEFDVFLAQVLRWLWSKNPGIFGLSQKTVRVDELAGLAQISDIENILLEKEIDEILRGSRTDQFAWLEKNLKATLGTDDERWKDFIEAHERRHLCVHTGCRVSRQYIANCSKLDIEDLPKLGESVSITPVYIAKAASTFSEMAVMTSQVIWRKVESDPHEEADNYLIDITYKLLEDEKYRLAAALLYFALQHVRRPSSDRVRKIWLINYAQALKRLDRKDEAAKVIEKEDWSAASADFEAAVAVLREDFDAAADLMRKIGRHGFSESDYRDWPLFTEFRRTEAFLKAYRDVFGKNFAEIGVGKINVKIELGGPLRFIEPDGM